MKKYTVWISCGNSPWDRTYFNELGAVQLTQEQISKYFTFSESGEIEFDSDVLSEETDRDWNDPEKNLPTWDDVTEGCLCWGPDADDQYVGVCLAEDDENQIWVKSIEELPYYTSNDIQEGLHIQEEHTGAIARIISELDEPDGVWIVYNSYERGSYVGEFELPDDVQFDPSKLVVNLSEVAESWTVVTGFEYDGEDIYCDGDTMGKGIDWYVYYKGQLHSFK
jgi:hypothetical protein